MENEVQVKDKKKKIRLALGLLLFLLMMVVITIIALPYVKSLYNPEVQLKFKNWINSLGIWGLIVVLSIQMLQVVVAFVPGEPIELIAGVLYGGIVGMVVCMIGCIMASALIFLVSKKLGRPFIEMFFGEEKLSKFQFLNDSKKLETIVFILFFIPGTPKDMLTYVAGTTDIKLSRFILLSTLARIPSVITSTFMGATLVEGNWVATLCIFAVTAVLGIGGILFKDKFMDLCHRM